MSLRLRFVLALVVASLAVAPFGLMQTASANPPQRGTLTAQAQIGGRWVSPAPSFSIRSNSIVLRAQVWDGGSNATLSHVNFTAFFNYKWVVIGRADVVPGTSSVSYTWTDNSNVRLNSVPNGPVKLSFDIYPKQGRNVNAPDGFRIGYTNRTQAELKPLVVWPVQFENDRGTWAIVNGYRGHEDHWAGYPMLAFDLALCPERNINRNSETCTNSNSEHLTGKTTGLDVLAPVTGTVAWVDVGCLMVAIEVEGKPGYFVGLSHVNLDSARRSGRIQQGQKIGTVAAGGCYTGGHLHLVLYTESSAQREAVPFVGQWAINGCEFPDNQKRRQYEDVLLTHDSRTCFGTRGR